MVGGSFLLLYYVMQTSNQSKEVKGDGVGFGDSFL